VEESDDDVIYLRTCYSVGSFGAFPIEFYRKDDNYYYHPMESDHRGPFESLEAAVADADGDFGCTDGGFWETIDEAEAHVEAMRAEGFDFE